MLNSDHRIQDRAITANAVIAAIPLISGESMSTPLHETHSGGNTKSVIWRRTFRQSRAIITVLSSSKQSRFCISPDGTKDISKLSYSRAPSAFLAAWQPVRLICSQMTLSSKLPILPCPGKDKLAINQKCPNLRQNPC